MHLEETVPVLDDLLVWMNATLTQISAKSPMALAIGYSLSHWTALTRFVKDGRIEAHNNNTAERALRGVALGRKNYLHTGSDAGGQSAAVVYTLLGSAKLNGINPQRYLHHVLERIADHPSNRIDELLPRGWSPRRGRRTTPMRRPCRWRLDRRHRSHGQNKPCAMHRSRGLASYRFAAINPLPGG